MEFGLFCYIPAQLQFPPYAGNGCASSEAAESQGKQEYLQYCRQGFTRWGTPNYIQIFLPPPRLGWRRTMVPMPGCKAQIPEIVLCCGSTAYAQPLSTLSAQHWSYPLLSLGKRVSVTLGDTILGLPGTVSSNVLAAPAVPCQSLCCSPNGLSGLASPDVSASMADWEIIYNFCSHSGISIAEGSGTSLGSAVGLSTAPRSFSPHQH